MAEINFEVVEEIGIISEDKWPMELNKVSWNGKEAKFDIRVWSPDKSKMGKGVALTEEQMEKMVELYLKSKE